MKYSIWVFIYILCFSMSLVAQPVFQPVEQAPVDGGLLALAVAGIGYGLRKVRRSDDES